MSQPTSGPGQLLAAALAERATRLRPAEFVMQPGVLGAARLTRYSFGRTMLRRAATRWSVRRARFEMDAEGRGHAVYVIDTGRRRFSFIAFTTTIDESQHTDRVIANSWEITAALLEGEVTAADVDQLRVQVPMQEGGRFDPRVLVLTRGNRSVRFFQYLVDRLAQGLQPEPGRVADAGYIMRSTAFYANGKYGMRSFEGYPKNHELAAPYRAQLLTAWIFRELSYDVVEHCAEAKGGSTACRFDQEWSRYFGLGNATGLGLVPYAMKHPGVINAWVAIREMALADVRALQPTQAHLAELAGWIQRAGNHFGSGTGEDCSPFLSAQQLVPIIGRIANHFELVRNRPDAFDVLYRWAEAEGPETSELVVSLLIELHDFGDDLVDRFLAVPEPAPLDPLITVAEVRGRIAERFGWLDGLSLDHADARHFWWVISDNTEEPRRVARAKLAPSGRDVAIDIAVRIHRLGEALAGYADDVLIATVLSQQPVLRLAVERVCHDTGPYGEPRDNACAANFLPLQLQRFQLAMYGMDNLKPKSTDWLRATLFQGAPRCDFIAAASDDWVLPPQPVGAVGVGASHDH